MKGMTLIELVITIAILGILAAVVSVILVPAFEAYFASQRRAELADTADAALRRMARDLRLALPNSPRVDGTNQFLEILLTKNGGRYRSLNDSVGAATTEDPLVFGAVPGDTIFDTLGTLATGTDQQVQINDFVVIHNLGIAGANAYDTGAANPNIVQVSGFGAGALANEDRITLSANNGFPLESPGRRFFVVSGPVTYACAAGSLLRWSGYAIQLRGGLPPTTRPAGATEAVLANNLSACALTYATQAQVSRGLVGVRITATRSNESVALYYEAHVNNVP
jgi:MSHA biogenesis protein MshO